jgi:predicted transposase/invertase (TIGR01784 family)
MPNHDASYRKLFSSPRMVQDLLTGFVKEDWIKELDFTKMEPVETSFVSDALRTREADVIWKIQWRQQSLYVYLLLEMQSSPDPMMAVRLLSYVSLLYQDLHKNKQLTPSGHLPPVFPITIYNGDTPWTAATDVSALIEPVPGTLKAYQPQLHYFLLDEHQSGQVANAAGRNLVAALVKLENSDNPSDLLEALALAVEWLRQDDEQYRQLRRDFTEWLGQNLLQSRFPDVTLPVMNELSEVKDMLAKRVDEWTRQWERQGEEKGSERALLNTARNMLDEGMAPELIARVTGLSLDQVNTLKNPPKGQAL